MSFGFSISDFVTVAELANRLHRDVISVAREASEELSNLSKELGAVSALLNTLKEDISNPASPLAQSGPDRLATATSAVQFTGETLRKIEQLRDKHGLIDAAERSKVKKALDRLKFTKDLPTINNLRSKLNYHYNILTLLLVAGANSSLERIETTQKNEAQHFATIVESLEKLHIEKALYSNIGAVPDLPSFSAVEEKNMRDVLSRMFMEKAEGHGSWLTVGIDAWLQAGKWWLLRYSSWKASEIFENTKVDVQAYTDLLKAAWIMIDVIKEHPQRNYIMAGTQQMTIRETAESIALELSQLRSSEMQLPTEAEILQADLSIFGAAISTPLMIGRSVSSGPFDLKARDFVVLFQKVGTWRAYGRKESVECVILVLYNTNTKMLQLVGQDPTGRDVLVSDFKYVGHFRLQTLERKRQDKAHVLKHQGISATSDYSMQDDYYSWDVDKSVAFSDESDASDYKQKLDIKSPNHTLEFFSTQDCAQFFLFLVSFQTYRAYFSKARYKVDLPTLIDICSMVAATSLKWKGAAAAHIHAAQRLATETLYIYDQLNQRAKDLDSKDSFHDIVSRILKATRLMDTSVSSGLSLKDLKFDIRTTSHIHPSPWLEDGRFKRPNIKVVILDFIEEARKHDPDACALLFKPTSLRRISAAIGVAYHATFDADNGVASELLSTVFGCQSRWQAYAYVQICLAMNRLVMYDSSFLQRKKWSRRKERFKLFCTALPDSVKTRLKSEALAHDHEQLRDAKEIGWMDSCESHPDACTCIPELWAESHEEAVAILARLWWIKHVAQACSRLYKHGFTGIPHFKLSSATLAEDIVAASRSNPRTEMERVLVNEAEKTASTEVPKVVVFGELQTTKAPPSPEKIKGEVHGQS